MKKRNKAWRQEKRQAKKTPVGKTSQEFFWPEKNWKMMTFRSEKLKRAQKLGVNYPRRTVRQLLDEEMED